MKRIQLYVILALAILLTTALIFWHYYTQKPAIKNSEESSATNNLAPETNAPLVHEESSSNQNQQTLPTRAEIDAMQDQTLQKSIQFTREQSARLVAERSKPIAFYGKVVDEETQAVTDASVHFMWVDPISTSETNTTSATDGTFSLTGVLGGAVNVDVWKTGYYVVKSLKEYNFDNTGNGSSQGNPVLFHLRKKGTGTDLITSKSGFAPDLRISAPLDGTPMQVDLLSRKVDSDGSLEISQNKPQYLQARQATNWSFKMQIPNGGFVEENDEFPFEAPESGYQSIVEFDFQQGQPNWTTDLKKDYYVKFGNPPRYGYLHLETTIGMNGARLTYAINPNGSRYLEPKSSNP